MTKRAFDYGVQKVDEGTYIIDEYLSTMALLIGRDRALVIDCGTGVGDFLGLIKRLTDKPFDVVATHAHVDHVGGRGQFDRLYVSAADANSVKGVNMFQRRGYILINKFLGNSLEGLVVKPVATEPELITIAEGDVFDLGERTVRVIETPGHTIGSLSFLDVERRVLYIGDVANENLLMFLPHCTSLEEMIATHDKILSLPDYDTIWSSHHVNPNEREDVAIYREGARRVLEGKSHNALLPCVKTHKYEGAALVYRTNNLFKRPHKR